MIRYIDIYNTCVEKDRLPHAGLCSTIRYSKDKNARTRFRSLFGPTEAIAAGRSLGGYWADDKERPKYFTLLSHRTCREIQYAFNPLRQNMLLLLAAMNNEL